MASEESRYITFLLLMEPGVWYCPCEFVGCQEMPSGGSALRWKVLASLGSMGLVESAPVFDGYLTKKHRITRSGIDWLATHSNG